MAARRLIQSFRNATNRPQFVNLELSTARFRLDPGEELFLHYDADERQDDTGSALAVEFIDCGSAIELVVWTSEDRMFFRDGRAAVQCFDAPDVLIADAEAHRP